MGAKILGIMFLIVAIGAALYISRSGSLTNLGLSLPHFNLFPSSTVPAYKPAGGYPAVPPWRPASQGAPTRAQQVQLPSGETIQPRVPAYEIPSGFTEAQLSPYFHEVRFGGVSAGSDFSYGQISLYAGFSGNGTIDVTGWLLQARDGGQYIPQAINNYDPYGAAAPSDMLLRNGDYLNMYTNASAIGANLHLNKCIGYLQSVNNFVPSLPLNCPSFDRSELSDFSGECQDYILSLNYCGVPGVNLNVPANQYACQEFLNTVNYKGCYDRHVNDPDFFSHEWRAWTGTTFLDPRHDKLQLLDKQGLLVDYYEY